MKLEEQHFTQPTPALKSIRAHTRAHTHLHTYVHPNTHIHPMRTTPRSTCQEWSWWMLEMQQCDRLLRDQLGCSFRSTLTEAAVLTGHPPSPPTQFLCFWCVCWNLLTPDSASLRHTEKEAAGWQSPSLLLPVRKSLLFVFWAVTDWGSNKKDRVCSHFC